MKKLGKKIISVLIVLCIVVSMMVMAVPSTQAFSFTAGVKKKALDLGLRFACAAATQLAERCENDDLSIVVNSVIKYIISDAHGAATTEIKNMCKEILKELAVIEEDIRECTSVISSSIELAKEEDVRKQFEEKWTSDVSGILDKYVLDDILNSYTKYLVVSTLYASGKPDDSIYKAVEEYWKTISSDPLSYKYEDCVKYQQEFIGHLMAHMSPNEQESMSVVYENAQIFVDIKGAIDELIDLFVYDDVANHAEQYSVIESAATYAYYELPFSSQQYQYTVAQAKRQVMVATLLEMALNEFLSLQGEYLTKNGKEDMDLSYVFHSQKQSMKYIGCKSACQTLSDNVLKETCNLFESSITVNCRPYSGEPSYECTLDDYMKPEDAVAVNLSVNGFESYHHYVDEMLETEMYHMYIFDNMHDYPSSIQNPTRFIRVMAGGNSGEVYYILDPSQYSDGSYLDFTQLKHDVKRKYIFDGGVGDLHIVSCDYYNIIKQMTDGVNTYKMPSSKDINTKLHALVDVPSYFGAKNLKLSKFLAPFAPSTVWGEQCSTNLLVLTSTYDNNLRDNAPTAVKRADIYVVDANEMGSNSGELTTNKHQISENLNNKEYSFLAILASDTENAFSQKVSLKVNDNYNTFSRVAITDEDNQSIGEGGSMVCESGKNLKITFSVEEPYAFDTLKLIRKNAENSETILLSGADELAEFINNDGTYTFEVTMPYSDSEVVLTSREVPEVNVSLLSNDTKGYVNKLVIIDKDTYDKDETPIVNMGETVSLKEGEEIMIKVFLKNSSMFDSLVAIIDGVPSVLMDSEGYMELCKDNSTYEYITTTVPSQDVVYILNLKDDTLYNVSASIDDPSKSLSYFLVIGDSKQIQTGESAYFREGEPVTIKFILQSDHDFDSLIQVNRDTQKITVLADETTLSTLEREGNVYLYYTEVPDYDVDYVLVSKGPDFEDPEELQKDSKGRYIISTYEDLRSMAYYVNNSYKNENYAEYVTGDYILANDINVGGRVLEPVGGMYVDYNVMDSGVVFNGTFDGQGYAISNMTFDSRFRFGETALFGYVGSDCVIKNLQLKGDYTVKEGKASGVMVAPLVTLLGRDAKIENVQTNLNYVIDPEENISAVAGLVYMASTNTFEKCIVNNTMDLTDITGLHVASGFVCDSSSETYINCASLSTIKVDESCEIICDFGYMAYSTFTFQNCYSASDITGNPAPFITKIESSGVHPFTIVAENSYYLDTMVSENADYTPAGIAMTSDEFESGEVAYLLNSGVTDGTQVWYQNLDNGRTPDTYPLFEGGTVYESAGNCIGQNKGYTNNPGEISHNYNNYHVCKDCITLRPDEAAGIYGFSIGLGGNISVQYYMLLDEEVAADPTAKMVFTVPSGDKTFEVTVPVAEAQTTTVTVPALGETRTLHIFECEVAAKEMASEILCQVVSDTDSSDIFSYTVKEYAEVILANPQSFSKEIPLVKAMLNYGAEAQIAFGHNLDNLANTSDYITEEEKVLADVDFTPYAYTIEDNDENIGYYGSALSLKSETAIKLYFSFDNPEDVANTPVTVNGKPYELKKNGTLYELKIADIPAHKLGENYEVKVGDITLNYSVFSYCNSVAASSNANGFGGVGKALYAYNQAALTYKGL